MINSLIYDEFLHFLIEDIVMFKKIEPIITDKFFVNVSTEPYFLVFDTLKKFIDTYDKRPSNKELLSKVVIRIKKEKLYNHFETSCNIKDFFDRILTSTYTTENMIDSFLNHYEQYERVAMAERLITEDKSLTKITEDLDRLQYYLTDIKCKTKGENIEEIHSDDSIFDVSTSTKDLYNIIPTGYPLLDKYFKGGIYKKQLGVIVAPPNKGKTALLLNMAYNAAAMGYRVLVLEGEMTRQEIGVRVASLMSGKTTEELADMSSEYRKNLSFNIKRTGGALFFEEFEMFNFSIEDLESKILYYKEHHNIDAIYVDYFDIMKMPEHISEYRLQLKYIYGKGKQFARVYNVGMITPSQTNRAGSNIPLITEFNIGEDFSKVATADKILSWNSTQEEYNAKKGRILIIKNRGGFKQKMIEYDALFEIMQIIEIEEKDLDVFTKSLECQEESNNQSTYRKGGRKPVPKQQNDMSAIANSMKELYGEQK